VTMLGGMTASVFAWSMPGEVSTFVPVPGILLGSGGVITLVAPALRRLLDG